MPEDETSGFLEDQSSEDDSPAIAAPKGNERSSTSHSTIHYSIAQLIGDVIGFCRTCVRFSVITTGLVEHIKWSRWAFTVIEFIILYTSSAMQLLNTERKPSITMFLFFLIGPIYSTLQTLFSHAKCIFYGIQTRRHKGLYGKKLLIEMEAMARHSALYWMTEDALLLGSSALFLTLAHQADWLQFPLPNKFFLTKSIREVCMESTGITSLNLPEWVLCGVGWVLGFFSYWPMDYLFITRIWILLWSCMWACDFVDFTWSLFVFPKVKGKAFRPGPVPQLHQAVNRLMELGFRAFAIVLSSSLFIPMIFRSLLADEHFHDKDIFMNALYTYGYEAVGAYATPINDTEKRECYKPPIFSDCQQYNLVSFNISDDIHDIRKSSQIVLKRDSYSEIHEAVEYSILIYCLIMMLLTILYHCSTEYLRRGRIRVTEFHVIMQKSVLFAPYSRYLWGKRKNEPSKFRSAYIALQIASIPMLIAIAGFVLMDFTSYDFPIIDGATVWESVLQTDSYPGGVFNYVAKYLHYFIGTNIWAVTVLPCLLYYTVYCTSIQIYFNYLPKIRNYEFSSYRSKYTRLFGEYQ